MAYSKKFISEITDLAEKNKNIIDEEFFDYMNTGDVRSAMNVLIDIMSFQPAESDIVTKDDEQKLHVAKEANKIYMKYITENPRDFSNLWFLHFVV